MTTHTKNTPVCRLVNALLENPEINVNADGEPAEVPFGTAGEPVLGDQLREVIWDNDRVRDWYVTEVEHIVENTEGCQDISFHIFVEEHGVDGDSIQGTHWAEISVETNTLVTALQDLED